MIADLDYVGLATLVTAIGTTAVAVVAAIRAGRADKGIRTMNELTVGELAAADETRRIQGISPGRRTPREVRHVTGDVTGDDTRPGVAHDAHDGDDPPAA